MAVRRLADDSVQPPAFAFSDANADWAREKINDYPEGRQASAVIPFLMRAQDQEGWVSRPAIETIASMLEMPFIRVLEVATFYTQFQLKPVGERGHVQVCGTTPCMLRGADDIKDACRRRIGEQFHVSEEGLSWEEVECLGACVNAPMVLIGHDTYEDLDVETFDGILDAFAAGQGENVPVGPQVDRFRSAPEGGRITLLDDPTEERPHPHDGPVAHEPATEAGRPDTFAPVANPAVETPMDEGRVERAAAESEHGDVDDVAPVTKGVKNDEPAASKPKEVRKASAGKTPSKAKSRAAEIPPPGSLEDAQPMADIVSDAMGDAGKPVPMERPAEPDDLKRIKGVGPKIERTLHDLGIWTFAQIAAWTEVEERWVDGYLRFGGRIGRDEWIRQAATLAAGGEGDAMKGKPAHLRNK